MCESSQKPLKVLFVTHESNLTGASRSLLDLLTAFNRDDVEPTVLISKNGPLVSKLDELGVRWVRIPYRQCVKKPGFVSSIKGFVKQILNHFAVPRVARFMKANVFDIVHCNTLLADVGARAAQVAGISYVEHVREFVNEDHNTRFMNEEKARDRLQKAAMNIFISKAIEGKFLSWAPHAEHMVMFDGIDSTHYRSAHSPMFTGGCQIRLLIAGRIAPGKGQLEAVRGVEELRHRNVDAQLTVIGGTGDKKYRDELERYVQVHRLSEFVEMLEFTDDISSFRARSDACLVCSSNEAMGRVTVEAMMAGCLVVAANRSATNEIVDDGHTGLLYEWGNPGSLADRVQWAIDNSKEANQIAADGKTWALDAFDAKKYAARMVRMYRSIAG